MMRIAPGQITTFFLSGINTILPPGSSSQRATQVPLPLSLAGFSATVSQLLPSGAIVTESLPLVEVNQFNNCFSPTTPSRDCVITELTVQIPVDLRVDFGRFSPFSTTTTVAISDGSRVSQSFRVELLPQNFHIITTCDAGLPSPVVAISPAGCSFAVTHANGALVTPLDRAKPGEELVMYALGLGVTSPAVPAGQPTPSPAPVATGGFSLSFAYSGELTPSSQSSPFLMPNPMFVGLAPGEVGLYQVNFTVQPPNGSISGCDGQDAANLRIVLSSNQSPSFDTARICVVTGN